MTASITREEAQIANWVTIPLAIAILVVRFISGQHWHKASFDVTTVVILASIAILIARIVVGYLVLHYDTAASILLETDDPDLSKLDLPRIRTGTILSLISRLLITTLYWLQCILLLLFYTRILSHIRWVKLGIRVTWVVIGLSYIAVVLATFLECRPFQLYWQLHPNPGNCIKAYTQLYVQCACNIIIDLFLLAISYPVLETQGHHSRSRKYQIGAMYTLGAFCIIITCIRLAYIRASQSAQPARSFWASVQAVISTFVANAPSIYGAFKLRQRKKTQSSSANINTTATNTTVTKRRTGVQEVDTYVLMEEMERDSRHGGAADDGERDGDIAASRGPLSFDSTGVVKQDKNNGSWVSETEIVMPRSQG